MDQREAPLPVRTDPYRIAHMPSKELLEEFLRGMGGPVTVVFDTRAGAFVRVRRTREVVADRVLST